jgi:hypothetical protein
MKERARTENRRDPSTPPISFLGRGFYHPYTHLSPGFSLATRRAPNATLTDVVIKNCGTGIRSDGAVLDLQGVDIIDCGIGIDQRGGHIQGKRVRITQTKTKKIP